MFCDEVEVKLRDRLTPSGIAKIKYPDSKTEAEAERNDRVNKSALRDKREKLIATLEDICRAGELEYEGDFACWANEIIPNSLPKYPPPGSHIEPQTYKKLIPSTIKIHNTKFKKFVDGDEKWFPEGFWQELIDLWIVKELVAEGAGMGNHAKIEPKKKPLTKRDKQQVAILGVIKAKGFKPMAIPDGEKGTIKSICEFEYKDDLFKATTAFDAAWKIGINKLWRMENHESYAHRGNN